MMECGNSPSVRQTVKTVLVNAHWAGGGPLALLKLRGFVLPKDIFGESPTKFRRWNKLAQPSDAQIRS